MKKLLILLFAGLLLVSCSDPTNTDNQKNSSGQIEVGIAMPNNVRWRRDGSDIKSKLEQAGYSVDVKYAEGQNYSQQQISNQISQINDLISNNVKVLVIAPVNGYSLTSVLAEAKSEGIKVISYDRLIMDSDAVSYSIGWNNEQVGQLQAEYLIEKLNLENREDDVTMEFFTGDETDINVQSYFYGAMEVLRDFLAKNIRVYSNDLLLSECATPEWKTEKAKERMERIISIYEEYNKTIDAVLCSNDSTAQGVTEALLAAGYTEDSFPLITGQDCDIDSVKNIIKGTQSMSVLKETSIMTSKTVDMVKAILSNTIVPVNKTVNNGEKNIPAFLCDAIYVDKDNWRTVLVDSGYYTEEELQL
ncbi:xylose-binding protein [Treponema bryantii]|uniref:Xylose-binding protein n=1 Tax=Treponema bryantii TaxID=163 RepID=A0A1H9EL66_9SPIR|nr:sugar-binding protein [Treponema bryantii]SEQ26441.1 xylose-binding protein [Treponema bryantii]